MDIAYYAEMAVLLVNTEDPGRGRDQLTSLDDLRAFLGPHRSLWRNRATAADVAELREVRARLRAVFEKAAAGDEPGAVDQLNALLADYPVSPQISGHDHREWHLHMSDRAPTVASGYAANASMGLAMQMTTVGVNRLGVCQAPPCRDVYIDVSTNRSRRYCSDRCATRANVAAYRARRREQAAAQV